MLFIIMAGRRRLMNRERELVLLSTQRIKTSGSFEIPSNAKQMDVFLVGGGGGGGSWYSWGYTCGMPGTGGGATLTSNIPVVGGDTFTVSIGAGGTKAKSFTEGAESAANGETTMLIYNDLIYSALGGVGGINSVNGSNISESQQNTKVYGFIKQYGVSQSYKGYYNGNIFPMGYIDGGDSRDYIFVYPDKENEVVTSYSGTYHNPPVIFTGIGIPEFFEPSTGVYYAQPGNCLEQRVLLGSPNDSFITIYNYIDAFYMYQTLNPGAGGFGGYYGSTEMIYGGDGQPGIAVIRYWGYE